MEDKKKRITDNSALVVEPARRSVTQSPASARISANQKQKAKPGCQGPGRFDPNKSKLFWLTSLGEELLRAYLCIAGMCGIRE